MLRTDSISIYSSCFRCYTVNEAIDLIAESDDEHQQANVILCPPLVREETDEESGSSDIENVDPNHFTRHQLLAPAVIEYRGEDNFGQSDLISESNKDHMNPSISEKGDSSPYCRDQLFSRNRCGHKRTSNILDDHCSLNVTPPIIIFLLWNHCN